MEQSGKANSIHPTAILEGNIVMGYGNEIGPYTILRGNISIGNNNIIHSGSTLTHDVIMGDNNILYPYQSIGAIGEMGTKGDRFSDGGKVIIGNHITLREFVCIHAPVHTAETRIHDHVYLMNKSYIAHDCMIGRGSVLSAGVLLGGQTVLEEYVTIGLGAAVHQRCHIGTHAMVGMQTPVSRDILPYSTVAGNPARIIGFNRRGAERCGFEVKWLEEMNIYFNSGLVGKKDSDNPMIRDIVLFLQKHPDSLVLSKM